MLCHPQLAQQVLVDHASVFVRGGMFYEPVRMLVGEGLPAAEGLAWRRQRRMMQRHFHNSVVARLTEQIANTVDTSLRRWAERSQGRPVDIEPLTAELAMSVTIAVIFGDAIQAERTERLRDALGVAVDQFARAWLTNGLPPWLPLPTRRRFATTLEIIDEEILAIIEERRRCGELGDDLLSLMLGAPDSEMSDRLLRDELVSLFVGGYETTSTALSWGLAELARRPEVFRRLRAEAQAKLGPGRPSAEAIRELVYARQVFDETLRVYPPAIWTPRMAARDIELDGHPIEAGQTVMISIYNIHHHPEQWDAPARFDPERFAPGATRTRHRLAFMPYGAGKHTCIGKALANLEGTLALAEIARRFDLELAEVPELRLSTTIRSKRGIHITLREPCS